MTPTCLGSTVIFDGEGVVCRNCSYYPVCESRVTERLAEMKVRLGPAKRKVRKQPVYKRLDAAERVRIEEVESKYKKAGALMRAIFKNRIDMDSVKNGGNPFANIGSHEYMGIAIHRIHESGNLVRSELATEFEARFGWTRKTANSHVGVVCAVLDAFGLGNKVTA